MLKKIFIADIRSNSNDGKSTGHFIPVARMYQNIFNNSIIAGGPIYKKYFKDSELLILPYNISGTSLKDKIRTMKNCIKLFNVANGHIIILQQSSVVTSFLAILLFYHSKSKLYLIQYSNDCFKSIIGRVLYKLIKYKIDGIICPTEKLGNSYGVSYCVVPDYIYIDNENKNELNKDYNKTIYDFCILGRIAPEKGVIECAKRFVNSEYRIIIAGKPQTSDIENELKRICNKAKNIDLLLDYISDEQYNYYIRQSKFALLNYQETYSDRSSGVVFDMLFNNLPVIGKRCETLDFIEEKKMGYLYSNIYEFNPQIVMQKELYNNYIGNIHNYRTEHRKYIYKLKSFILEL